VLVAAALERDLIILRARDAQACHSGREKFGRKPKLSGNYACSENAK
jgi:hypothetical protein